eukprot:GFKZ01007772.1.p1 GENE.GFKZ01007772.1~~GFKZ01007772.1.p1  ORF type:complete len:618 (+),score=67.74 GFKZ01007772.1:248-2101(+)
MQYEIHRTEYYDVDTSVPLESIRIDERVANVLRSNMGISSLFDMQVKVSQFVTCMSDYSAVGDVILCAPTGSGKTLAYALPIIDRCIATPVKALRAIIVVPTRDLALQVHAVFATLVENLEINLSVISGAAPLAGEKEGVHDCHILVATPGRLVHHLQLHGDLNLAQVRYLVLDESDRLLEGPYQQWVDSIVPHLGKPRNGVNSNKGDLNSWRPSYGLLQFCINPEIMTLNSTSSAAPSEECVRKILVSATQTDNPTRVVKLGLRNTVFFTPRRSEDIDLGEDEPEYVLPSTLKEKGWIVRDIRDKPMALLKILGWSRAVVPPQDCESEDFKLPTIGAKLIFTNSVESSHRLCRLLEGYAYITGLRGDVLEMSGELSSTRRKQVLDAIRNESRKRGKSEQFLIVVCSDVLARGMDMLNVDAVINYDMPLSCSTYVHRVGRTARAGRPGVAVTIVLEKQARHFRLMLRGADRGTRKAKVKNINLLAEDRSVMFENLSHALTLLKRFLRREKLGLISPDDVLPEYALHEIWLQMQEVHANQHGTGEGQRLGGDQVAGFLEDAARGLDRGSKKRKYMDEEHDSANIEEDEDEEMVNDLAGHDVFRDLLYGQIARNILGNH